MAYNPDSEDALEIATMALFESLGWERARAYHKSFSAESATARKPYLWRTSQTKTR